MKWDIFIGRKGGMNNILAPLKNSTNNNDTSSHTDFNRSPKLDAITPNKREEEPIIEDGQQSPTPDKKRSPTPEQQRSSTPDKKRSPTPEHQEQQEQQLDIDERPQSPTPEQQHQRQVDDHQHVNDEETKAKELLKGKPIIFVGGGPGK